MRVNAGTFNVFVTLEDDAVYRDLVKTYKKMIDDDPYSKFQTNRVKNTIALLKGWAPFRSG